MSKRSENLSYEKMQDEILEPEFDSILKSLGEDGAKIFSLRKTRKGYKFVECCDEYYGITLKQEQFRKLIEEMTDLLESEPIDE